MRFPKILSILLHPIFMPTFVMLVLLYEVEFFNMLLSNYKKTLIIIVVIVSHSKMQSILRKEKEALV